MTAILSLTESNILQAMGDFIVNVTGVTVVQGQDNRVAEPGQTQAAGDFAVMWPTLRERLETNTAAYQDVTLTGSIAGTVLTVTEVAGAITVGAQLYGVNVTPATFITAQLTGTPGGEGTYTVNPGQTLTSQALEAGLIRVMSPMKVTIQVDVHGPNSTDNTQRLVTLFRDDYACEFFAAEGYAIQPLYIDDGSQIPFVNAESQYEDRWVLMAKLQANPTISTGVQFADTLTVGLKEIDVTFPPGDA